MGGIVKQVENILKRHLGAEYWKVIGELVERDLYWVDVDIYDPMISFKQLNDLVNEMKSELRKLGFLKDKVTFTSPAEEAVLRLGFPLPHQEKVSIFDLIKVGLIHPDDVIFGYHYEKKYEATITSDGKIKTLHDNEMFKSPSSAARHITGTSVNGWYWWKYKDENGKELWITNLRTGYRQLYDC